MSSNSRSTIEVVKPYCSLMYCFYDDVSGSFESAGPSFKRNSNRVKGACQTDNILKPDDY
jgi:hypothetical protein